MEIALNKVLPIRNPRDFKIHFATWNGIKEPLDVFIQDPEEWKGWNSFRGSRDDFNRPFIFSLIRCYHQKDMWLFGGVFKVLERRPDRYLIRLSRMYPEFVGRLLFRFPGPRARGRAFLLEKYCNELKVTQLLDKPFGGEAFVGDENVEHTFSQLEQIIQQDRPDWKGPLENVKGVYLIVDRSNGKMYVGSAYGDAGIWSRWTAYVKNGHGGNDQLTPLIAQKGIGYRTANVTA